MKRIVSCIIRRPRFFAKGDSGMWPFHLHTYRVLLLVKLDAGGITEVVISDEPALNNTLFHCQGVELTALSGIAAQFVSKCQNMKVCESQGLRTSKHSIRTYGTQQEGQNVFPNHHKETLNSCMHLLRPQFTQFAA